MIETIAMYRSTTLRAAPDRLTLAEAEADEARGVEVEAFLALLPTLTPEQWQEVAVTRDAAWTVARDAAWTVARDVARDVAWNAAWTVAWNAEWTVAWNAARDVAWNATLALVVRDLISPKHLDTLIAPMRAAGVDFDNLIREDSENQGGNDD